MCIFQPKLYNNRKEKYFDVLKFDKNPLLNIGKTLMKN